MTKFPAPIWITKNSPDDVILKSALLTKEYPIFRIFYIEYLHFSIKKS